MPNRIHHLLAKKILLPIAILSLTLVNSSCEVDTVANIDTDEKPEVIIVSPADNAELRAGKPVKVMLTASNEDIVDRMILFLNGESIAELTAPPFQTQLDASLPERENALFAKAFSKTHQSSISNIIRFVLVPEDSSQDDADDPEFDIISPPAHATIDAGTNERIVISTSDESRVKEIEFIIDGNLAAVDSKPPFQYVWNTENLLGSHSIFARMIDTTGNIYHSDVVPVEIVQAAADIPPAAEVMIVSPANDAEYSLGDTVGVVVDTEPDSIIASVSLFVNGSLYESSNKAPYSYKWVAEVEGKVSLFAKATDVHGRIVSSNIVVIDIKDHEFPPVFQSYGKPSNGATIDSLALNLSWEFMDQGSLRYTIHFGKTETPPLVEIDYGNTSYQITGLEENATYFWQIEAVNQSGQRTTGPVWSFKTAKVYPQIKGMIFIDGGSFTMGCDAQMQDNCHDNAQPSHTVEVSSFYMSETEITSSEYFAVMGPNGNVALTDIPVTVSWYEAVMFCNRLSYIEGLTACYTENFDIVSCDFNANGYRLPTEAEWEFAAKGGNSSNNYIYSGSDNLNEVGRFSGNSFTGSEPALQSVKTRSPNEIGLYDMSGNAAEWCWDWYKKYADADVFDPTGPATGTSKVTRGGSVSDKDLTCQTTSRSGQPPSGSDATKYVGFRVVKSAK